MALTIQFEVWVANGGDAQPYQRRPDVEAQIGTYELQWQAGRPSRGIFRSASRWACVPLDDQQVPGEQVQPVLPLIRVDAYADEVCVWRGWVTEERFAGDEWLYEAWGLAEVARLTTLWLTLYGTEHADEVFLQAVPQILQAWDGGRTTYTIQADCPKRVEPADHRGGIAGSSLLEWLEETAPRHFMLEGEWEDGRWGVRFREPQNLPTIPVHATILEQTLRMHTVRNRVQIIGASDYEASRAQLLRNGDLTRREAVKSPRDLIDDPHGAAVSNSAYWQLAQNVVSDTEPSGGYTGDTFARFTANSGCRLYSAVKSIEGYEGLTWRASAAFRKGTSSGNALVLMAVKARNPTTNQTTTLWIGTLTLTNPYEWKRLESPPVAPRPDYTQMWLEIESFGSNNSGVRIDAIHLATSGERLRDWQIVWLPWSTNLPQAGYGYADPHANGGKYGLEGGAQVWLEPGWGFVQRLRNSQGRDITDATLYLMLWYTRGQIGNTQIDPEVVLWHGPVEWQHGSVWYEGAFDTEGHVRWRLYRWQGVYLLAEGAWVGLWSDTNYLWGISMWGAWCAIAPVEDTTGFLGSNNDGRFWAEGFRTAYRPHTELGSEATAWMARTRLAWGARYGQYRDEGTGRAAEAGMPHAWRLRTQVVAEPYRQLRVAAIAERVEQLQPHRYFWRVGIDDYFVGTLTLRSDGQLEASLHEPETDLIRALRRVL